jgi:uncharacterized protein YhbP (UPF0306 family)
MKASELIPKYLAESKVMQIATHAGEQPWICTVYYVEDKDLNLYWLSLPTRRHSQEIKKDHKVAVAVPVKLDQPVIGIQAEGRAELVEDKAAIAKVMKKYVAKYGAGKDFLDNFVAGKNQHALYKFTPKQFVLFDEVNFAGDPRQQWQP